jgi:2-dehydro-3-deoxy-D-arabinonate dehydratase
MYLTRHQTPAGPRWAVDGKWLPEAMHLDVLLQRSLDDIRESLTLSAGEQDAEGALLAPVEDTQEIWAAGVTYLRSREARMAESDTKDISQKVYEAERVEVFFKAVGWRAMGHGDPIRVRRDSTWDVPEPELAIVMNRAGDIVGYSAGNDVSSRSIEGENPLYLPQAKIYRGSCAIGPGIRVAGSEAMADLPIRMHIERAGETVYEGETATSQLKRSLDEMAGWLYREMEFPEGAILLTGTCLVPADEFTLSAGDRVHIEVGGLALDNPVES